MQISDYMSNMDFDIYNDSKYLMSKKQIIFLPLQLKHTKSQGMGGTINEIN